MVAGALDEQVKQLGYTTEPKIPYMVLHDPPGDGSSATLATTTQSCRTNPVNHRKLTFSRSRINEDAC